MDLITVDFETYYDQEYSLSKMTTEAYIRDPRFSVIGVSTKVNDAPAQWVTGPASEVVAHLHSLPWSTALAVGQNMAFDGAILSWRCDIHPKALADTMLMSRAVYGTEVGHSLKALAERRGAGQKGHEVQLAKGKRRKDFTEAELAAYGRYCQNDVNLTEWLFRDMVEDGFPQEELQLIDITLRMFTEPVLELDAAHLRAHLKEVRERKQRLLDEAGVKDKKDLMSNPKFAARLEALGVTPPMKISTTTGKETFAFAKTDEDFVALEDHPNATVQTLVSARLGNKSTLEETRTERLIDIAKRGPLPGPIRYYAAHTGRWGGMDKINLQNLPSRGANAKQIKKGIVAPDGYVLIDADSSQIEARVLAWLAEQEDMVDFFDKNNAEIAAGVSKADMQYDPYKIMASRIYGTPVTEVTNQERQVGKTVILGAGYGVGHVKLQSFLKTQAGVEVSLEEAKEIIDIYRATNSKISGLWKQGQKMLEYMIRNKTLQIGRPGALRVDALYEGIQLPSGMWIRYPDLKREPREDFGYEYHYQARGKSRKYIYGGKCLAGDTRVLTDRGWVKLRDVTQVDRVWDGARWVSHAGLIYQGEKATTVVSGVRMTPDHNILTTHGWRCASSSEGLHRAGFWLPDGSEVSGDKWPTLAVGLPMHLRDGGDANSYRYGKVCPSWWAPVVRVQSWGRQQIARYVAAPSVRRVAVDVRPVPPTLPPSMAQLWRAGYSSMRALDCGVREFLGRHGARVSPGPDAGPARQLRELHPRELSLGDVRTAGGEPETVAPGRHPQGEPTDGYFSLDTDVPLAPEPVYDLLNAGPDARFVVLGSSGPFIVHNCVENVTQALARCVVADQMRWVSKRYRPILTVHDSIICCVREEEAPEAQEYIEARMRRAPDWAPGLPVNCESEILKRYGGAL